MLEFAVAVFFMLITPGPGVLTTAGVGAGFGRGPGLSFVTGLWAGTNAVQLLVATGLAAVVFSAPGVRTALTYASVAFFVYLAAKIAFSGAKIGFIETAKPPGFIGGFVLQFINPKAYAVSNLVFSGYAFWPEDFVTEVAIKFAIMNAIWIPVHFIWLWAGVTVKRLDLPPRTQRIINFAMAASLLAVVGLAVLAAP